MAANVKHQWCLKKYAKFIHEEDLKKLNDERECLDSSCKGFWKLFSGENKDLMLSYLESYHCILTKQDIILESFYLPCSKSWVKGVAKADSLLVSYQLENGNTRKFRIQFCGEGETNGFQMRKQCTDVLQKYFTISDLETEEVKESEIVEINESTLSRLGVRKAYMTGVPRADLKEVLSLCLTDISFPSLVAEVQQTLHGMATEGSQLSNKTF